VKGFYRAEVTPLCPLDYGPAGARGFPDFPKEGAQAGIVPDVGQVEYITAA